MSAAGGARMALGASGNGGVFGLTAFGSVRLTAFCVFGLGGVVERTGSGGKGEGALADGVFCEFGNSVTINGAGTGEDAPSGGCGGTDSTYHRKAACNSNDNRMPVATLKRARVLR